MTHEKQKTAVDWLIEKLKENALKYFEGAVPQTEILISNSTFELLINEAKELEKQQIIDAFDTAYSFNHNINDPSAKQYYKKIFE